MKRGKQGFVVRRKFQRRTTTSLTASMQKMWCSKYTPKQINKGEYKDEKTVYVSNVVSRNDRSCWL